VILQTGDGLHMIRVDVKKGVWVVVVVSRASGGPGCPCPFPARTHPVSRHLGLQNRVGPGQVLPLWALPLQVPRREVERRQCPSNRR